MIEEPIQDIQTTTQSAVAAEEPLEKKEAVDYDDSWTLTTKL